MIEYGKDGIGVKNGSEVDDGTMPESLEELKKAVVGHRVVKVERDPQVPDLRSRDDRPALRLTLDDGTSVLVSLRSDCCAYTEITSVVEGLAGLDHIITDVKHDGDFEEWYIVADASPVLTLGVEWSCGNPFYYAYGFSITVEPRKD